MRNSCALSVCARCTASTGEWLREASSPALPHSSQTKRRRSLLEIRKLLSRFHSSALSRTAFVQAEELSLHTLSRYHSAHRVPAAPASQKAKAHSFLELEPSHLRGPAHFSEERTGLWFDLRLRLRRHLETSRRHAETGWREFPAWARKPGRAERSPTAPKRYRSQSSH
jgi:hypothetical protein